MKRPPENQQNFQHMPREQRTATEARALGETMPKAHGEPVGFEEASCGDRI
jgi:hypothetical protein